MQKGFVNFFILTGLLLVAVLGGIYLFSTKYLGLSLKTQITQNTNTITPSIKSSPQTIPVLKQPIGVAFMRITKDKDGNPQEDIWRSNIDGSNQQQLTHDGNIENYFLLNSNQIIFNHTLFDPQKNGFQAEIIKLDLTSNNQKIIYSNFIPKLGGPGPDLSFPFIISPDGKYLVCYGDFLKDAQSGAVLINLTDGSQADIFAEGNISPFGTAVFSPDSKYLAALVNFYYRSKPSDPTYSFYTQDLYVLSLSDRSIKKITNSPNIPTSMVNAQNAQDDSTYKIFLDVPMALYFWSPNNKDIFFDAGTGKYAYTYNLSNIDIITHQIKTFRLSDAYSYTYLGISPNGSTVDAYYKPSTYNGQFSSLIKLNTQTSTQTTFNDFLQNDVFDNLATTPNNWLYLPAGDKILYTTTKKGHHVIHIINSNMDNATDKTLIDNATNPQWIY